MASRPKTLPATISPVVVGVALAAADGHFKPIPAVATLLAALLIQIGVNMANDYFDFVRGIDTSDRIGPVRVAASGLISLENLRLGIGVVLGVTVLLGVYLAIVGGWPIVVIGLASILAVLAYSGGPYPIASNGLGDLFAFIFFGLVAVGGTYYIQAQSFHPGILVVAIPNGVLITDILIVNNLRDIDTDGKAGKRTFAVIIGRKATRIEFLILLIAAYLTLPVLVLGWDASPWIMLALLSIPLAIPLTKTVFRAVDGPTLNKALAGTARLTLVYSLLFALGLML
jgi:1,4-dihydroxy-2-naphthoate octaprenyltransferase